MGLFDIFSSSDAQNAAQAQITGLNNAFSQASGNINQGIGALQTNYSAALQPYLQNYTNANAGITQLGNVLGLNGTKGNATALQALQATPGYQFALNQGDAALNAQAAATGKNASGNQALALSQYNQGAATQNYNNYVSQLTPYLNASNAAAGGIANVNTGLGNALAGQYGNLGNLAYGTQTGIGNANANADLAGLTASGNLWNAIGSIGGMALGALGGFGGLGGIGSALSAGSAIPGAFGATSVGGPNGPTPLTGGSFLGNLGGSIFSDERLKENLQPVGKLFDGTNVYRFNYKGNPTSQIGVLAQEVEGSHPDTVGEQGGYKTVDYGRLADKMRSADQAAMSPETYSNPLVDAVMRGAGKLAAIPGQAFQSQTPITTADMIKPAADMAMGVTLGAGAVPAEANALRMGAKLPGSLVTNAYKSGAGKSLSEMTEAEKAAWRAQLIAEDEERARTFAARRAAANTPTARRAQALRDKQNAEDEARMRLEDEKQDREFKASRGEQHSFATQLSRLLEAA